MKQFLFALVAFIGLSAHSCNKRTMEAAGGGDATAGAAKLASLLGSKWSLQSLAGSAITMPEGVEAPWIRLTEEGSKLEGFGGCNQLFGDHELNGDRISFGNVGSTKKYCEPTMATETAFLGALRGTDGFKMNGEVLKLLQDGREVAALKQE